MAGMVQIMRRSVRSSHCVLRLARLEVALSPKDVSMANTETRGVILIRNGRVYDHDGDVDLPPIADLLIVDGMIAAVRPGIARAVERREPVAELGARTIDQTIDATEKLVMPGFVNAHYHSHDVLLKGCFETIPLELWVLSALPPSYPKRSTAEIRARTLLGALECLRSGITTVQDLVHDLSVRRRAPRCHPAGLRGRRHPLRVRAAIRRHAGRQVGSVLGRGRPAGATRFALRRGRAVQGHRSAAPPARHRGVAARSASTADLGARAVEPGTLQRGHPDQCSPNCPTRKSVPVYTHIYESKAMTLIARQTHRRMAAR